MVPPEWLPPQLLLNGARIDDDYAILHKVYSIEISHGLLSIEGFPVWVDRTIDQFLPQYNRGFTHLVTRDDGSGQRIIDYDRARKLNWVKPVIENYQQPEIHAFWCRGSRNDTLYLWLYDYDFVVIMRKMRARQMQARIIVTSFSVDPHRRKDLQRRFAGAHITL